MDVSRKCQGSAEEVPRNRLGSTKEVQKKESVGSAEVAPRKCQRSAIGVWTNCKVVVHCTMRKKRPLFFK